MPPFLWILNSNFNHTYKKSLFHLLVYSPLSIKYTAKLNNQMIDKKITNEKTAYFLYLGWDRVVSALCGNVSHFKHSIDVQCVS